jgi:hypothetical protein
MQSVLSWLCNYHDESSPFAAPMMMASRWIELVEIDHLIREYVDLRPENAVLGGL